MTYQGEPISAVFFSGSCGKQPTVRILGQQDAVSAQCGFTLDKEEDGYEKQLLFQRRIFIRCSALNPVKEVGSLPITLPGYVKSITIDRIVFSGRDS